MDQVNSLNYSWEILKIFLYLSAIIVLIYGLNYFLRNSRRYFGQQGSVIKVIDRGFLSQHAQVYIVKVADKYYLLGLTEDKITLLDTFDELRVSKEEVVADLSNSIFMEIFKKTLKKRDGSDE